MKLKYAILSAVLFTGVNLLTCGAAPINTQNPTTPPGFTQITLPDFAVTLSIGTFYDLETETQSTLARTIIATIKNVGTGPSQGGERLLVWYNVNSGPFASGDPRLTDPISKILIDRHGKPLIIPPGGELRFSFRTDLDWIKLKGQTLPGKLVDPVFCASVTTIINDRIFWNGKGDPPVTTHEERELWNNKANNTAYQPYKY